jgi:8-oxo-dGTP pyrophosphatase MutT (NUDIX family)
LSIRALLFDSAERLLLFRFQDAFGQVWWATPGGGAEPGESDEATLRRELVEEAGLHDATPGPLVWSRVNDFAWGGTIYRQTERFYIVRIDQHEVAPTVGLVDEGIHGHRWWSLDEITASEETFAPRSLGTHVRALHDDGAPPQPLELDGV